MENIFVGFLPPWVETGLQPAFYDKESGTVLQQTARMYDRVNMLVRMFNKLSKTTKEEVEQFEHDVTETVDEYIAKFTALKDFVDDYFENLDVQEEINNKLDAMVEAGTLQEIITTYIQSNVAWTFDTVADMKVATNLADGSFAHTLGYYNLNDGGDAFYKIRTATVADTPDNMLLIAITDTDLVAELIVTKDINLEQLGSHGNGSDDDTTIFSTALNYIKDKNITLNLYKSYKITAEITVSNAGKIHINGHNATLSTTSDGFYFNTIDELIIENLNVNGYLNGSLNPTGSMAHALYAKKVTINNINGKYLAYIYKNDYVLTNNATTQFVSDMLRFTNIHAEDCTVLLTTAHVKDLVCENIFNIAPEGKTRELFYLEGGIVNSYFTNISADTLVRWMFHYNVSGASTTWDFSVDLNKNKNCFIQNVKLGSAQCLLHFQSYCENIFADEVYAEVPLYIGVNNYTCETINVSNSLVKMPDGSTASTVNYVKITGSEIRGNSSSNKATIFLIDNCHWVSTTTTTVFFMMMLGGKLIVQNSHLVNDSATQQQAFQTSNGDVTLIGNTFNFNKANRLVAIVGGSDKVSMIGNIIEASTNINALNTNTAYINANNYIGGVLQS